MATTSNTYTGNGSNKLFSITFPYLETSDVDVYLNGTLQTITTQYTFANATTVEFVAAPANGATVKLDRSTDDSENPATFFPGSSIKAADLNENFDQTLYVVQEINNSVVKLTDPLYANKTYIDAADALKVNKAGDTMSGNLAMGGNKVTGLGTPSASADAVTKSYVDGYINTTYLGPLASDPSTRPGGAALQAGDQYFNTTQNIVKVWTGSVWVISAAAGNIVRWRKTASAGNTTLSSVDDLGVTLSYVVGNEQVYLNGALQTRGVDYTAGTGTSITLTPALLAGDVVELHAVQGYVSATITPGSINDALVAPAAGIQYSKLALSNSIVNADVNASAGITAGKLSFTQTGTGATARTVDSKLKDVVSVKDFGAVGDGVANDTAAFNAAVTRAVSLGGAIIRVPFGTYKLTDFVIDKRNILFEGEVPGVGYESASLSVKLIPGAGAKFVARLKGVDSTYAASAALGSGFRNVQFYDSTGTCEYGVFIDSGSTILQNVIVQGFQYGCVIADQANSNIFDDCTFILNTKVGFAVTEASAASYIHPGISGTFTVSSTRFQMTRCLFRQNDFGMVLRTGIGASFDDCGFESNNQAGIYMYRPDSASLRQLTFKTCWSENNYQAYTSGSTSYSITGNRMFLIGNSSTYITWTSANQAGYQLVIDAQTRSGGGGDTIDFYTCQFSGNTATQKLILILSGFKFNFYKPWITGGDTANNIRVTTDAEAVHWHDPLAGNAPTALVTSITDSFGANSGSRGAYFKSGTSFVVGELGGTYPILGVYGGPIQFPALNASDPRRSDARVLDEYYEAAFGSAIRLGGAIPFNVLTQDAQFTKIGRVVHLEYLITVEATATTAATDKLYIQGMPYPAATAGKLVGQAWIQPTTGVGNTVLNSGLTPLYMLTTNDLYGVTVNFPVQVIGYGYDIRVQATYTSAT